MMYTIWPYDSIVHDDGRYLGSVDHPPGIEQAEAVLVAMVEAGPVSPPVSAVIVL